MGRILAIDYGRRRTGIAVSDPLCIIAGGLTTVETPKLMDFLAGYIAHEQVDTIVLGEPFQPNGEASENLARVREFAAKWKKRFPTVPIVFYDERFTSVLAHRAMIDGGLGKQARRQKALVDEISATILLEDYMRSLQMRSRK